MNIAINLLTRYERLEMGDAIVRAVLKGTTLNSMSMTVNKTVIMTAVIHAQD